MLAFVQLTDRLNGSLGTTGFNSCFDFGLYCCFHTDNFFISPTTRVAFWASDGACFFRLLALSFIVAALFEPSVTRRLYEKHRLPVLVDVSKSMSIKDQHAI